MQVENLAKSIGGSACDPLTIKVQQPAKILRTNSLLHCCIKLRRGRVKPIWAAGIMSMPQVCAGDQSDTPSADFCALPNSLTKTRKQLPRQVAEIAAIRAGDHDLWLGSKRGSHKPERDERPPVQFLDTCLLVGHCIANSGDRHPQRTSAGT